MKIIDITQEMFSCRVYPGDRQPVYERVKTIENNGYNLTNVSMCVHNGTHVDALSHFIKDGKTIDELELPLFYGECTVAEFDGIISEKQIKEVLKNCRERLILKGQCELSEEAAAAIAASHVRLVGVESQSIGKTGQPKNIHIILLGKGIIALEGLEMKDAQPGEYILAAFPLKMQGSDGSPVRAVLIEGAN